MKNNVLLAACLLFSVIAHGQYFIYGDNGKPVTIQDIINAKPVYKEQKKDNENIFEKENTDDAYAKYQRSLWYWVQHKDAQGNLISDDKRWDEWATYKGKNNFKNARVTGNTSNWQFQGPDTPYGNGDGLGRINALAFHPTDPNTYWVGSAGGGAWKTTNNGASWTAMTDNLPNLLVSAIAINPQNANTIYLCTGDREPSDDFYPSSGIGVLKSYDGGATWTKTFMDWKTSLGKTANDILINPLDTNCVILATESGIYKSMNGGATWKGKATGKFTQIVYKPGDTNVIYACAKATLISVSPLVISSGEIYRSTDGGDLWTQVSSFSDVKRVSVAVTPANPNIVKAIAANYQGGLEGVYSSSDMGSTYTQVFPGGCGNDLLGTWPFLGFTFPPPVNDSLSDACGGQGGYDLTIAIDPTNANNVCIGGTNAWYSTNGGVSWTVQNIWLDELQQYFSSLNNTAVVHADKHVAKFHPLVPGRFFDCNDGGIFYTDTAFAPNLHWYDITRGLHITQLYSHSISEITTGVLAGAQDNSSMYLYHNSLEKLGGGDGFLCQQDPVDSTTLYMTYVKGGLFRQDGYNFKGAYPDYNTISNNIPGHPIVGGAWPQFALEPSCHTCIIAGYDRVWRSTDKGDSWTPISPVFAQYFNFVGVTAADPNTIYAMPFTTNVIFRSFNMGASWDTMFADPQWIYGIETDPRDKTHFWINYYGYGPSKVSEYSNSKGWTKVNNGLPDVPIYCVKLDTATRILYAGTDVGVFYKADTGNSWQLYDNGLPVVPVTQLNISYTRKQLWASTYGRGMWMSPKAASIPSEITTVNRKNNATIYPNPNSGDFTFSVDMFYANKRVDMRLVDAMGRTVWTGVSRFDGSGKVQVNTNGLAKGNYFFEAATENEVIARNEVVISR